MDEILGALKDDRRSKERIFRELAAKYPDEDFSDKWWLLEESKDLGEQLAVIGLYRIVELYTKKILGWVYTGESNKSNLDHVYRWQKLKFLLSEDLGVTLTEVRNYDLINELRLLCNDIKHVGRVRSELAEISCWREGEEITQVGEHLERLAQAIPGYLEDLVERINTFLAETIRKSGSHPNFDLPPI